MNYFRWVDRQDLTKGFKSEFRTALVYLVWRAALNYRYSFPKFSNWYRSKRTMSVAGLFSANFWRIPPNMSIA